MRFDENAQLDTSNIDDLRGSGGGGGGGLGGRVAVGGGGLGIIGLILYFLISALGGGGSFDGPGALPSPSGLEAIPSGQTGDTSTAASACRTGAQANQQLDCEVVAVVNSLDNYWTDTFARSGQRYTPPRTVFFNGRVNTGCGGATSDTGPFYCPADKRVYIDLTFYKELEQRFGAQGGNLSRAYVIAHEYGHHVQDLLGTTDRGAGGRQRPDLRLGAARAAGRLLRGRVDQPRRQRADVVGPAADRGHHPAGHRERARHRRRASATTTSRRTSAAAASTPRSSPTARRSSARSGSPPATTAATRRSATRSPAASTWADPAEQGAALLGEPRHGQRPRRTDEGRGRDEQADVLGATAAPHQRLGAVAPVAEPPGDAERARVVRVRRRARRLRARGGRRRTARPRRASRCRSPGPGGAARSRSRCRPRG